MNSSTFRGSRRTWYSSAAHQSEWITVSMWFSSRPRRSAASIFQIAMIEITHCSSNECSSCVPADTWIMATILERLFAMCVTSVKCQSTVDMLESVRKEPCHPEGRPGRMMGL